MFVSFVVVDSSTCDYMCINIVETIYKKFHIKLICFSCMLYALCHVEWLPLHYEKSCLLNHTTLQLKLKKQLIYDCYATIPWVLQILCNYPLKNMMY